MPLLTRPLYACRCAIAACLAYELAQFSGLEHSIWAPISALVVSHETARATLAAVVSRCVGTAIGATVAVLVGWLGERIGVPVVVQLAGAVAICAAITVGRTQIRVSLWTAALVLVLADVAPCHPFVALYRAWEVILGAVAGGATAALFDCSASLLRRESGPPWTTSTQRIPPA